MIDDPPQRTIEVFVANEQSDVSVDERRLISLMRLAALEEGVDPRAEVTILLVERTAMASLKEKWLGEPGATDVLAFPMDEQVPDDEPYIIGDIVICPDVAREQATASGDKVTEEVDLLLVHGFLHLLGYDHVRPQDARSMRHRERKILSEFYRRQAS
ncbi:MAG TPA: rRNA maturation RNase YbeY [Actinomycetota bacterium]|jgi:probable rRNA maturation factor|nr:rRNA maturation RNase YbeY [Actinomycetota bacterium]